VVPLEARAQLGDRARRIGMLLPYDPNDPVAKTRVSAFMQALAELGWTDGHNVRMDLDWAGGDINRIRALAHELVALQPDIVVVGGTLTIAALQRETTTIPTVMTNLADPVGSGFVAALNRTGGSDDPQLGSEQQSKPGVVEAGLTAGAAKPDYNRSRDVG
jgi:putative tryptophan/tyrosine transport system substrate-binding protein